MGDFKITDGTGGCSRSKVDNTKRLHTRSVSVTEQEEALRDGKDWNIETGYLTLTTDTASDVLYLKNTGERDLKVILYVVLAKASTGGSGDLLVGILRNPTAGTVVSDANEANIVNMNFGSTNEISGDVYYGGEGKTLTGHDNEVVSKTTDDTRLLLGVKTELPKGSSVGVRITPPSGNTSIDVNCVLEAFEAPNI